MYTGRNQLGTRALRSWQFLYLTAARVIPFNSKSSLFSSVKHSVDLDDPPPFVFNNAELFFCIWLIELLSNLFCPKLESKKRE